MKKIISAVLVATAFSGAHANEGAKLTTGGYAGLTFNAASTKFDLNDNVYNNGKKSTRSRAANLGVVTGYGVVSNNLYYGAELFFISNNQKKTIKDLTVVTRFGNYQDDLVLKHSNIFGIAARMGYLVVPSTMVYVRVGAEHSKWKAVFNNKQLNKSKWTFVPGLGLERAVGTNVSARMEWDYAVKQSITNKNSDFSLKTDGHRFSAGLFYRF